jgi:8-oxo-dGTP pyrophosphatase MutT (NUDIX family)
VGKNTQSLREFSSGGVVFKKTSDQILWFVRKTMASDRYPKSYWMLSKGRLDDTVDGQPGPMTLGKIRATEDVLQKTAVRETKEEGGIMASIIKKIGTVKYSYINPDKIKILKFVTFYLMEYVRDLPEGFDNETSEIAWLTFDEAKKKLSFGGEKEMLVKAQELLRNLPL